MPCRQFSGVTVIGSYNKDLFFRCTNLPIAGQTVLGEFDSGHGGKGFNQAFACHQIGCETEFHAAIGQDEHAKQIQRFAADHAMPCHWQLSDMATGTAAVLTDNSGENQIVVAAGANQTLQAKPIIEHLAQLSANTSRILLLQCETSLSLIT